jgi:D-arabinose 1-dehydrogenase-like Zn-dependent alcohol dehydrogenase
MSIPKTCKAFVLENPSASGHLQQIPIELPQRGEILIKVHACGVCSGDVMVMSGVLGSLVKYPLIPGHEIVGTIVAVGEEEKRWEVGDLVGGGYHGGHDGTCRSCNSGFFQMCEKQFANGLTKAGGCMYNSVSRLVRLNVLIRCQMQSTLFSARKQQSDFLLIWIKRPWLLSCALVSRCSTVSVA